MEVRFKWIIDPLDFPGSLKAFDLRSPPHPSGIISSTRAATTQKSPWQPFPAQGLLMVLNGLTPP
jgi:hypothetical protein